MKTQLVLWDIDGTLLQTEGAGRDAMRESGRDLVGKRFEMESVSTSGRLDPQIWSDVARLHGVGDPVEHEERFREAYRDRLERRFSEGAPARALPGVPELVERLREHPGFAQGLLTGNYPETGQLKLTSAGLRMEWFPVRAWGCDAPRRPDLVPVALDRAERVLGAPVDPRDVIIIGDTPNDVACAVEHGCRSLAVGTGTFAVELLERCGASAVRSDLSDVARILAWLEGPLA